MIGPFAFNTKHLVGVCLIAAALLAPAVPAGAQSLWTGGTGSLVSDLRARRAGDIVTILIDEQSTADKRAETDLKRDSSFASRFIPPAFEKPKELRDFLAALVTSGTGKSEYNGDGKTTRTDRATGIVTAKIMRVLDNGNLVLEGRRVVKVNDETQTLVVSGIVRPQDIQPDNTVISSRIADGEVRLEGEGAVSDRQKPGLIQRIFDFLGLY
jgi:flagellar L-ring protein precursor FlgH